MYPDEDPVGFQSWWDTQFGLTPAMNADELALLETVNAPAPFETSVGS